MVRHYDLKGRAARFRQFKHALGVFGALSMSILHGQCPTPSVSVTSFGCGTPPTITASGSTGLYRWYNVASGGSPLANGSTYSPGNIYSNSNLVYYVEAVDNVSSPTCISPRTAIVLNPVPLTAPTVSGNATVSCGGTTTITASASASTINWYDVPTGGTPIYSGTTFNTPPIFGNGKTFYVEAATGTSSTVTQTFNYTGGSQSWVVPTGVTSITFDVVGASGGDSHSGEGGRGGRVQGVLPVTPGQTIYFYVGGKGNIISSGSISGGWNGGGTGYSSSSSYAGGSGGGASDIRIGGTGTGNRYVVAGGGGGAGSEGGNSCSYRGGHGGGLNGEDGLYCNGFNSSYSGRGGTQSTGGCGQAYGSCGSSANGGAAYTSSYGNGGGGGGYFGGSGTRIGGGGGGSSYTHASVTNVVHTQGYQYGHGYITITYELPMCTSQRVPVTVSVNSIGSAPMIASPVTAYCSGLVTLTPTGSTGNYMWFDAPTGGNILGFGNSFVPTLNGTSPETLYVSGINTSNVTNIGQEYEFNYTGSQQTWTVPAGVGTIEVEMYGASGGNSNNSKGGLGGKVTAKMNVSPGQVLYLYVGGEGTSIYGNTGSANGGWNGGGNGYNSSSSYSAGGGGGATDIRIGGTAIANRMLVAGGGGGAGYNCSGTNPHKGGEGGGLIGGSGYYCGYIYGYHNGTGGTQLEGGRNAYAYSTGAGSLGTGSASYTSYQSGGGGGGYYGGGGGYYGGGGGGSSYANPTYAYDVVHQQGVNLGHGKIIIRVLSSGTGFCETQRTPVVVVPSNQTVPPPTAVNDTVPCGTATASLQAIANGTINWYTSPSGGTPIASGPMLNVSPTFQPLTYYASVSLSNSNVQTKRFDYTGGSQSWVVPAGVYSIQAEVVGASGGNSNTSQGGFGGKVTGTVPVTPGQTIYFYVGGEGTTYYGQTGTVPGGWNGGGNGYNSSSTYSAGSGGGSSDIRIGGTGTGNRVLVAGAGGGAGFNCSGNNQQRGGHGGGTIGADGYYCGGFNASYCGRGGSQTAGGGNATNYSSGSGSLLNGAASYTSYQSGGGGGGYYGGGGGYYGGGGGGSSYAAANVTNVVHNQGVNRGHGYIKITYSVSPVCESQRVPVQVLMDPVQPPVVSGTATGCAPQSAALSVSGGSNYEWFDAPGGNLLGSGSTLNLNVNDTMLVFVNYTDNNGCVSGYDSVRLDVTPVPDPNIQDPGIICHNYPAFNLNGGYSSGIWSGTGIVDAAQGTFDPSVAAIGNNQIVFVASTPNGCTNSDTLDLMISTGPSTSITPPVSTSFCVYSPAVTLSASNPAGNWAGPGIDPVSGVFDPSSLAPGTYMLYHEVPDPSGCIGRDSVSFTINPTPDAGIQPVAGAICANATPFNLSANTAGGTWSGTGITSSSAGTFDPTLVGGNSSVITYTVTQAGCSDTSQMTLNLTPASLAAIQPVNQALCINGNSITLYAAGGAGTWTGNGITNASAGTFNPTAAGVGTTMVYYTIGGSCPHTDSTQIVVETVPSISTNSALIFCEGQNASLQATAASGYQWYLNGTPIPGANSAAYNASLPGSYSVGNPVPSSCQAQSQPVQVIVHPRPVVTAVQANQACEGAVTQFNQTAAISSGIISQYSWDFGDGNNASGSNPGHVYAAPGTYLVELIATSSMGCTDTFQTTVPVNPQPIIAGISAADVCQNLPVIYNANTSVVGINNASITSLQWQFGDGSQGGGITPTHLYNQPGIYYYTLTVTTNHGCTSSAQNSVTVYSNPMAQFIYDEGCQHANLLFVDMSSNDVTQWNWNFGDGGTGNTSSEIHTYTVPGSFPVTLNVTNTNGCTDAITYIVNVAPAPNAQFTSLDMGGGNFQFNPASISGSANYLWTFGDGASSTQVSPGHAYSAIGVYNVCLTVTRNGCETQNCEMVTVSSVMGMENAGPAFFSVYPNPFVGQVSVQLNLQETADTEIRILDLAGKLIAAYPQGELASGAHELMLNLERLNLSAGTYLLEIEAGNQLHVTRIVHIK